MDSTHLSCSSMRLLGSIYVHHLNLVGIIGAHPYDLRVNGEVGWRCGTRFLFQTFQICGDRDVVYSDLACGREFNGTRWKSVGGTPTVVHIELRRSTIEPELISRTGCPVNAIAWSCR